LNDISKKLPIWVYNFSCFSGEALLYTLSSCLDR